MLDQIKLNNKTYNEIFQKALAMIPAMSSEWTDYNYSDPGVTVLQVLSLIKLFQQSYVDKINDNIKLKLINLIGYDIDEVKPSTAHVKISSNLNFDFNFCSGTKLTAGDVVFETLETQDIMSSKLSKIVFFDNFTKKYFDATEMISEQSETSIYIFGKNLVRNSMMYLIFDQNLESNKTYSFYFEITNSINKKRKYIPKDLEFKLSEISWEALTQNGWQEIEVRDETKGFLQNGRLIFRLKNKLIKNKLENIGEGYIIRAVLKKHQYDMAPKIKNINTNVLEVRQTDTKVKSFIFDSSGEAEQEFIIKDYITVYNNIIILIKDPNQSGSYIKYHDKESDQKKICEIYNNLTGKVLIKFSNKKFGFKIPKQKDAIKIICYDDEWGEKNIKTKIFGFENQIIKLETQDQIISSEFNIMIKTRDNQNKERFFELNNLETNKESLIKYSLDSVKNQIKILGVNIAGDIDLVITDLVQSKGKKGNVRANEINNFKKNNNLNKLDINFVKNLYQSVGGKDVETIDEAVLKILDDISKTHSLVTKKDFENKIFDVPGVSIHKVKAINNDSSNNISIIIKPDSDEKLPVLTDVYRDIITKYLDKYRLITTKINILSPVYVPIDVFGSIYIKPNYKNAGDIIKNLISKELDGVSSDRDFGYEIIYGDLYSKIENLDCVDMIYSLSLEPASSFATKNINSNILLDQNALSYLGSYNIEINNNIMMVV
ncbi:MAG: baseplate J/gp47 family protein [Oscillospiraceae bacterium]|nr:baseplate J/gp47 family protein [Oscillospiraceae bacterium]